MNYFDKQEAIDSTLLNQLNDQLNWFNGMTANTRMSEIDYSCTDKKGRLTHVELKQRKGTLDTYVNKYKTVLIEPGKIYATTRIMESGYTNDEQRLYINFVDDGVIIFNLNDIKRMEFYPNHKQVNYGKHITENEDRFGLFVQDAMIYKYTEDGRLIKCPYQNLIK